MNILLISNDFYPKTGGIAQYDHSIARALILNNNRVWILTNQNKTENNYGYKIIKYPELKILNSLLPFIYALGLIILNKIDIVVLGYFMSTLGLGGLIGKKLGLCKLITVVCGYDLVYSRKTAVDKFIANNIMHNTDMVWVDSIYTGQAVFEEFNNKNKIQVLYPTVKCEYLINEHIPSTANNKKMLTVCRLVSGKGLECLLEAFVLVKEKLPTATLEIVGDGPLLNYLKDKTIKHNIHKSVLFKGNLTPNELIEAYIKCDVFVMPSEIDDNGRFEGFGIVFLEANALSKPVIGTKHGGIPEAIADGQTGLLVQPGNADELANAIIMILGNNKIRIEMGSAGRIRVNKLFNLNKMVENIHDYLNKLNV